MVGVLGLVVCGFDSGEERRTEQNFMGRCGLFIHRRGVDWLW